LQNVDEAFVRARDGFEVLDAIELAFVRPVVIKLGPANNFDRAQSAKCVAAKPYLAISTGADRLEQFEFGQDWGRGSQPRQISGAELKLKPRIWKKLWKRPG
jgi:hypothetical protein